MIGFFLVFIVLARVSCINFRSSKQFEEFDTVTLVMKKYLMITRCNPDRTSSDLFAVYPIRDGSRDCSGDDILDVDTLAYCIILPGNPRVEPETYQIFANVRNIETCYDDGEKITSTTGVVTFDWFKADSLGFSANATVSRFSYKYHSKCEELPKRKHLHLQFSMLYDIY